MKDNNLILHSHKLVVTGLCILALLTAIFLYDFNKRTDYQIDRITQDYLVESANQGSDLINRQINKRLEDLQLIADLVVKEENSEEQAELLQNIRDKDYFMQLMLIDEKQESVIVSGIDAAAEDITFYNQSLYGSMGLSDVYLLEPNDIYVVSYYVPAINDGQIIGELIATTAIENIVDTNLNHTFLGNAYFYVLDTDGTVIQQSHHQNSLYDGRNYFDFLNLAEEVSIDLDTLQSKMMNTKSGCFDFSSNQEQRFVYYSPLHINNWYLFTVISSDNLISQNQKLSQSAYYLTIKLVATFLCFYAAFYYLANRNYLSTLNAKKSAERSNRMFELALQHSFATMFEYDIHHDAAYFLKERNMKALCDYDQLCPFSELVFENECLNASHKDLLHEAINKIKQGEDKVTVEVSSGPRFQPIHWFRFTFAKLPSEGSNERNCLGIVEDITDEVLKCHLLAQEISLKEALFHEAISVWTLNLETQQINSYTRKGIIQDTTEAIDYTHDVCEAMLKIVHEDDYEFMASRLDFNNLKQEFKEGKEKRIEYRIHNMQGNDEIIWVESIFNYYTLDGKVPMLLCYTMDIHEEKTRQMELTFMSERDSLTGLYNRNAFEQLVNESMLNLPEGKTAAFFMMDLDEFKLVNDTLGHTIGDELLMQVAYHLRKIRDENGICEMSIARFGGDEFVAFLKGGTRTDITAIAKQILADISNIEVSYHSELNISVSIGIAFVDIEHHNFADLYESADQELYESKRSGKNKISIHN